MNSWEIFGFSLIDEAEYGVLMEWYRHGKSEVLGVNPVLMALFITNLTGIAPGTNQGICCVWLLIVFKNQVCTSQRTLWPLKRLTS